MTSIIPSDTGLTEVLTNIGRASTPQVPQNTLGLSLPRALKFDNVANNAIDFFGPLSAALVEYLRAKGFQVVSATPGLSHQIIPDDFPGTVVIDRCALSEGTWFGSHSETSISLREEIYELCRKSRQNGIPVWFLDIPEAEDPFAVVRIKSACDTVFPYADTADFEEGAKVSERFTEIMSYVNARFASEDQ
ncbi:MAG: hypothetical protein ACTH2A_06080 [Glutamicibacter ardleyensis]